PSRWRIDHCHGAVGPQELRRQAHVTQRGGKTNARHRASQCDFDAVHQRLQLLSAFGADERVKFIDDKEGHLLEQGGDAGATVTQRGFQGLRRDQEHPGRLLHELPLGSRGDIPMPRPDGYVQVLAEAFKPSELVVDQRFQRADVDDQALVWPAEQMGHGRQESGLGFPRGRAGCHDDILIAWQDQRNGLFLHLAQRTPTFGPQVVLYPRVQLQESLGSCHQSLKEASSSSESTATSFVPPSSASTRISPIRFFQSVPGFCSRMAKRLMKDVIVVRGVRKKLSPMRLAQCSMKLSIAESGSRYRVESPAAYTWRIFPRSR